MDAQVEGGEDKAFKQFVDDHLAGQIQGNSKGGKKVGRETHGPVCVSFEGNIGVGKSTILKLLHSHPRLHHISEVLQEPIGQWQNVNGTGLNMLEAFYKDPHRYAYLFQSFVFTTRFLQQNTAASTSKAAFLLTERSVLTDRCVFVETGKDQGYLNALEVAAYEAWYHGVVAALPNVVPDAFVYLRADPVVCYDRLKARARSEEAGVSLDYLKCIHEKHEKWFIEGAFENPGDSGTQLREGHIMSTSGAPSVIHGCPVFVLDCSADVHFGRPSKECDAVIDQERMLIPEVLFLNKLEILHEPCSKGTLPDQGKPPIDAEVRGRSGILQTVAAAATPGRNMTTVLRCCRNTSEAECLSRYCSNRFLHCMRCTSKFFWWEISADINYGAALAALARVAV